MQKFEILLNRGFSASTTNKKIDSTAANPTAPVAESPIFQSQQNLSFEQEYFMYLQQNGVSLVNNLNVKGYLNNPKNETLARDFVNYLSGISSHQEFIDILYDDHKLSDFFNDYYRKFFNYSNQGIGDSKSNPNIDLIDTKKRLTEQDKLYTKTSSLTDYYVKEFDSLGQPINQTRTSLLLPTDTLNFSGQDESYYINVFIEHGRKTFFSDDFSQYYQDKCDGVVTYNKYVYNSSYNTYSQYVNLNSLQNIQDNFNLSLGPSTGSIDYLRSLLPVNFLNRDKIGNTSNNDYYDGPTAAQTLADQTQSLIFENNYGYVALPQTSNSQAQILNFQNFTQFSNWFGFDYIGWTPNFSNPDDAEDYYIYQQVINLVDTLNQYLSNPNVPGGGRGPLLQIPTTPLLYSTYFENVPEPFSLDFIGQKFNRLANNRYKIKVNHLNLTQAESVIIKWEPCSIGYLGPRDGFNAVSFEINGNVDPTVDEIVIYFQATDQSQEFYLNLYPEWPVRAPVVLSMRPLDRPNTVMEYIVIYLDEFFKLSMSNSSEKIEVRASEICNLMYNSFVYKNFNDNFLEFQRPDTIPIEFVNLTGITLQQQFDMANTSQVNSGLLSVFNNNSLDLSTIAQTIGVSESGIYGIYVWGSYLFGTEDEFSDVDLVVIADGNMPVKQVKAQGVDIAVYTLQRFQYELDQIVVPMFGQTNLSDRVFTVYNNSDLKYKILERASFFPNTSKETVKQAALKFKQERWTAVEQAFLSGDVDAWQKKLWSIFRNLVFLTQFIQNGKITDVRAANSYLEDMKTKSFTSYAALVSYFNPKIENLYSALLSL